MSLPIKSLQLRLTLELTALFILAGGLALGGLMYSAMLSANSLADRDLSLRAQDLAEHVIATGAGAARLDLPPNLVRSYEASGQRSLYAIRDRNGALIASSMPEFGAAPDGGRQRVRNRPISSSANSDPPTRTIPV